MEIQKFPQSQDPVFLSQILDLRRCENERLRILVDFIHKPIHASGGLEPDPDIVTAYNLAVEAALTAVRRAAIGLSQNL